MQTRTETFPAGGQKPGDPATNIRLISAEPPGPGPHPAILLLHGAGGNTAFWFDRIAPVLARLGVAVYAVHYFDRTGTIRADMSTLSDPRNAELWLDTIATAFARIAERPVINPKRVALVGISLGAFLSLALATRQPRPAIRCIVAISGGLVEPFAAAANATFPRTLILHGDQDTLVPVSNAYALDALLSRLNIPHQLEILPNEGHWFTPAAQPRILTAIAAFLTRSL